MRRGLLILLIGGAALALGCSVDEKDPAPVRHAYYPVALDALAGAYEFAVDPQDDPPRTREIEFEIPEQVDDFWHLRVVLEGSWSEGLREIAYEIEGGEVVYDTLSVPGRFEFALTVPGDPQTVYRATVGVDGEDFAFFAYLEPDPPDSAIVAEDMLGAPLAATLSCTIDLGDEERLIAPSSGELTAVRLDLRAADVWEKSGGEAGLLGVK